MSYLEKLLDGKEVKWKPLGDVCKIETGKLNANAAVDNGAYAFFTTAKEAGRIDKYRWDTEALLIAGNANVGEVKHYVGKFDAYQRTYVLTNFDQDLNIKFLFFVIGGRLKKYLEERTNSAAMTYIVLSTLENFQIPIPCPENPKKSLEIQSEIVRILDNFTELTSELTSELTARKKQYNYYRDQLLTFAEDEVEWKPLGEVANFTNGKGHEKDIAEDGKYIVINSKFISTDGRVAKYSNKQISPLFIDDILIVMSDLPNGKALSKTFLVDANDKYTLNQRIGGISVKNKKELLPKFLQYFLDRTPQLIQFDNGVDQTNLRKDQILGVKIPIISVTEQARIVAILDKFDALTNSIIEGLPREIELRQKQYEYYRDLLLNFTKSEEVKA